MVTRDEYKKLLERERGRVRPGGGSSRDDAVRAANIAAGFGSSTAERFLDRPAAPKGGGGGAKKAGGGGGKSPFKLGGSVPIPTPRPRLDMESPDLAVSPPRPGMMWEGATGTPPREFSPDLAVSPPHERWTGATAGVVPESLGFPPDLAVSPQHERWPGATAPSNRVKIPANGVGVPRDPMEVWSDRQRAYGDQLTVPSLLKRMSPFSLGGWG